MNSNEQFRSLFMNDTLRENADISQYKSFHTKTDMSIFGDYFDDDYCESEDGKTYMYPVSVYRNGNMFTLSNEEYDWHSKNRQWMKKRNYQYKISTSSHLQHGIPSMYTRKYTYYFTNEKHALLFALYCNGA